MSADELVQAFTEYMLRTAKVFIPNQEILVSKQDKPWMNHEIKVSIRKRNRVHRKAVQNNAPATWAKYRLLRNKVKDCIRRAKARIFEIQRENIENGSPNARTWWKFTRSFFSNRVKKDEIGVIEDEYGNPVANETQRAELFNNFFSSISTVDDKGKQVPPDEVVNVRVRLSNFVISELDLII
jgi:hypothetical protein